MALKTTSLPLDNLTLTEWRDTIATWVGVSYANLPTTLQNELNRLINEAHDYVSKRFGHEPWTTRETTVAVTSSSATYPMPADFRHWIVGQEEGSTDTIRVLTASKADYMNAWGGGTSTHPWAEGGSANRPTWFFDGMTGDEPPVQQWKRAQTPTTSVTLRIHYRPYFSLLSTGADSYTVLPAGYVPEIRAHLMHKWAIYTKDFTQAGVLRQVREDEIAASQINDNVSTEDPVQMGFDDAFTRQMS